MVKLCATVSLWFLYYKIQVCGYLNYLLFYCMRTLLIALYILPFISYSQFVNGSFQYKDAIEHFLAYPDKSFVPEQDTIYFLNIDKTVTDKLPNTINTYKLKFISWEEAQEMVKSKVGLKVYQVLTTSFKKSEYKIHFLPVIFSNEGVERDYANACIVGYKKEKRKGFKYQRILCGFNALK